MRKHASMSGKGLFTTLSLHANYTEEKQTEKNRNSLQITYMLF